MIYLQLLWSFFQIGLFSFGGGYAALPLIQSLVVEQRGWLSLTEFTDLISISQMTPGPIALNAATFVGTRVAGFPGALVATLGNILPSFIIALALAMLYTRFKNLPVIQGVLAGLRPTVVALIASAAVSIVLSAFFGPAGFVPSINALDWFAMALFALGFLLLRKFKLNPMFVMLGSGAMGALTLLLPKG